MTTRPSRSAKDPECVDEPPPVDRTEFLTRNASTVGTRWSVSIRNELRHQGREPAGGFPGTLSELRHRLGEFFHFELRRASMAQLSTEEREQSTRIAYAAARKDWLDHRVAEPHG